LPAGTAVHPTAQSPCRIGATSLSATLLAEGHAVEPSSGTSHADLERDAPFVAGGKEREVEPAPAGTGELVVTAGLGKLRRLIADQRYFGLAARFFHAGAQRMLERIAAQPAGQERVDLECLGFDFLLEPAESLGLLRAMIAGGLLIPDGTGYYRPTARFREYAVAPLVAPLSRARAKMLVDAVCDLAAQINADWIRNPFEVKLVAVSGSYMSRSPQPPELSLWLVLRPRPERQNRRWRPMVTKGAGLRQSLAAVSSVSSFVVARIVAHKSVVPRPFCVAFQGTEVAADPVVSPTERVRELGASIGELLGVGYSGGRRGRGPRG